MAGEQRKKTESVDVAAHAAYFSQSPPDLYTGCYLLSSSAASAALYFPPSLPPPPPRSSARLLGEGAAGEGGDRDGEQRGRRRRGRGVAQGCPDEGHGGSPGPACQGSGQPDAEEVPAGARPQRGEGVGHVPQVAPVEEGGGARRVGAVGDGAAGPRRRQGLHGRRRPDRPPHPARLPRQPPLREAGHGPFQEFHCVRAGQHLCQDPQRTGEVLLHRGSQGLGILQLRHPSLHRSIRDHAELLPREACQGHDDPCALHVHEGLEDDLPLHRQCHQRQVCFRRRQELARGAATGDRREPDAGYVGREADADPPQELHAVPVCLAVIN